MPSSFGLSLCGQVCVVATTLFLQVFAVPVEAGESVANDVLNLSNELALRGSLAVAAITIVVKLHLTAHAPQRFKRWSLR